MYLFRVCGFCLPITVSIQSLLALSTELSSLLSAFVYSFQCRIQLQNTVQNTNRRLFQRYSAQELVHIYLRRASGTRVLCTLVQNAPCKYIEQSASHENEIIIHASTNIQRVHYGCLIWLSYVQQQSEKSQE